MRDFECGHMGYTNPFNDENLIIVVSKSTYSLFDDIDDD